MKHTRSINLKLRAFCALGGLAVIFSTLIAIMLFAAPAQAAGSVVRAVLFYSPTCPHCHDVINEDLPPLMDQYGDKLQIIGVDVTTQAGQQLYQAAVQRFQIPEERLGVPALIVGETVLVGSIEIPATFPGIIANGLAADGIDWPDIPGLREAMDLPEEAANETPLEAGEQSMAEKFARDPLGNGIAVIVLLGMLASLGVLAPRFLLLKKPVVSRLYAFIPLLVMLGIVVAAYLSFVEVTQSEAICGPVGDCNAVQSSPFARLFGILPVGVLGLVGYVLIGFAWLLERFGPQPLRDPAALALWIMAAVGVLFSVYLTFLEPFVIGATCAWCITSAVLITLILWASTARAAQARRS